MKRGIRLWSDPPFAISRVAVTPLPEPTAHHLHVDPGQYGWPAWPYLEVDELDVSLREASFALPVPVEFVAEPLFMLLELDVSFAPAPGVLELPVPLEPVPIAPEVPELPVAELPLSPLDMPEELPDMPLVPLLLPVPLVPDDCEELGLALLLMPELSLEPELPELPEVELPAELLSEPELPLDAAGVLLVPAAPALPLSCALLLE